MRNNIFKMVRIEGEVGMWSFNAGMRGRFSSFREWRAVGLGSRRRLLSRKPPIPSVMAWFRVNAMYALPELLPLFLEAEPWAEDEDEDEEEEEGR